MAYGYMTPDAQAMSESGAILSRARTAHQKTYYTSQVMTAMGMGADVFSLIQSQRFQKRQTRFNNKVADFNRRQALRRGEIAASQIRKEGERTISAQRASYAAQGVVVSEGSAQFVQDETFREYELDAMRTENNAAREAWEYSVEMRDRSVQQAQNDLETNYRIQGSIATGGRQYLAQRRAYERAGLNG